MFSLAVVCSHQSPASAVVQGGGSHRATPLAVPEARSGCCGEVGAELAAFQLERRQLQPANLTREGGGEVQVRVVLGGGHQRGSHA
jgi:hypothetical protein